MIPSMINDPSGPVVGGTDTRFVMLKVYLHVEIYKKCTLVTTRYMYLLS